MTDDKELLARLEQALMFIAWVAATVEEPIYDDPRERSGIAEDCKAYANEEMCARWLDIKWQVQRTATAERERDKLRELLTRARNPPKHHDCLPFSGNCEACILNYDIDAALKGLQEWPNSAHEQAHALDALLRDARWRSCPECQCPEFTCIRCGRLMSPDAEPK